MTLSIVISVSHDQAALERLKASIESQSRSVKLFIEQNDKFPGRALAYSKADTNFVLFLDADCELPESNFCVRLVNYFEKNQDVDVVGGLYLDPKNANTICRSYNKICNLWVEIGAGHNLLGGVFCIRKSSLEEWPIADHFWGGEDTLLFRELSIRGLNLQMQPEFSVIHHDLGSFKKLVRRAWIHGRVRKQRQLFTPRRHRGLWDARKKLISNFSLPEFGYALAHYFLVGVAGLLSKPKISPNK